MKAFNEWHWGYHLALRAVIIIGLYSSIFWFWGWQNAAGYVFSLGAFVIATFNLAWIFYGQDMREAVEKFMLDSFK